MERSPHSSRFSQELRFMEEPCGSSFILLDCSPRRGPRLKQFMKDCDLRDPRWSRSKARGGRSSRQELLWTGCDPSISHFPCTAQAGEEVEELRMKKWSWACELNRVRVRCFSLFLIIQLPSNWQQTQLHFPQVESVLPVTVTAKQSPCLYLNLWPSRSLPLSCWGVWVRAAGWVHESQPRSTHHTHGEKKKKRYAMECIYTKIYFCL